MTNEDKITILFDSRIKYIYKQMFSEETKVNNNILSKPKKMKLSRIIKSCDQFKWKGNVLDLNNLCSGIGIHRG